MRVRDAVLFACASSLSRSDASRVRCDTSRRRRDAGLTHHAYSLTHADGLLPPPPANQLAKDHPAPCISADFGLRVNMYTTYCGPVHADLPPVVVAGFIAPKPFLPMSLPTLPSPATDSRTLYGYTSVTHSPKTMATP